MDANLTSRPSFLVLFPLLLGLAAGLRRQPTDREKRSHVNAGGCVASDAYDLPATAGSRPKWIRTSSHQRAVQADCRDARARDSSPPQLSDVPEDDRRG